MPPNVLDVLNDCPLFVRVPPQCFARLVTMAGLKSFQTGEIIFRDGQPCPGVYVVSHGTVRVFKTSPGGKEHVLHLVGPTQTFAEVAAIGGFPVPASAEAVEPTTCVLLPTEPFRRALDEDHLLCRGLLDGMTYWVRHLVGLLEDVVLRDAAGRLARLLLELSAGESGKREPRPGEPRAGEIGEPGLVALPGLKRHMASHLNLTSETFSRTLRRLLDAGLIAEATEGRLRIVDRDALSRVAEGRFPKV